jgi:hypothetical protein
VHAPMSFRDCGLGTTRCARCRTIRASVHLSHAHRLQATSGDVLPQRSGGQASVQWTSTYEANSEAPRYVLYLDILPRLKAWDWRVPMSGCLGAHHSTAVSRGLLRLRRPTLSLAGATPAMPAASLVTFPDAGRCPDLGISPGDSVVAVTVAGLHHGAIHPPKVSAHSRDRHHRSAQWFARTRRGGGACTTAISGQS